MTADRPEQLDRLLAPRSVAVVGASTRPGWGLKTIQNMEAVGYGGVILPVNPRYEEVAGHRCFPTLADLPEPVDCVVFAIPAPAVPDGVAEAVACGIPAAVVYASGFGAAGQGEGGDAAAGGPRRQLEELCDGRIALLGPNCLGAVNYARRSAMFGITMPYAHAGAERGMALVAQSGNIALTLAMSNRGVPLTHMISCGNQLDVSAAELLGAVLRDPAVTVLAAVIEAVPEATHFARVLDEAADRDVAVVVLKIGESERGQAATVAHTGSLSGSAVLHRAFFRQHGAIQVGDLDELTAVAAVMSTSRRPRGRGVAVFAASGGECGLVADLADSVGVVLPALPASVAASLAELLPAYGTVANPLDITAGGWGDRDLYADVVERLAGADDVATIVGVADAPTIEGRPLVEGFGGIIAGLVEGARRVGPNGPTVALLNTVGDVQADVTPTAAQGGVVPLVGLRAGLSALARAGWYAAWRDVRDAGRRGSAGAHGLAQAEVADAGGGAGVGAEAGAGVDGPARAEAGAGVDGLARAEVADLLSSAPAGALSEDLAKRILALYGVPCPERRIVYSEDDAVAAAVELGGPVVLKIAAAGVSHKSEIGGVLVGLESEDEIRRGATKLLSLGTSLLAVSRDAAAGYVSAPAAGLLVECLVRSGVELIVGGRRDDVFGPAVMVGLGGVLTELLGDVTHRIAPVTAGEVGPMLDELKAGELLDGFRGVGPVDRKALARVVASVSQLMADHGRIVELDVNPIGADVVTGAPMALDALIVLSS